jgi:hypothetical protein
MHGNKYTGDIKLQGWKFWQITDFYMTLEIQSTELIIVQTISHSWIKILKFLLTLMEERD